jgi:prepilin-type N-terminal cleavage/methylation domain-containing protein
VKWQDHAATLAATSLQSFPLGRSALLPLPHHRRAVIGSFTIAPVRQPDARELRLCGRSGGVAWSMNPGGCMTRDNCRCPAFTLLEVVTVVVILGLLAAMAVPRFAGATSGRRVEGAAMRLAAELNAVRLAAYTRSASATVTFTISKKRVVFSPYETTNERLIRFGDEPYRLDLLTVDFGGDAVLIYDGWGVPDSGGTVTMQVGDYSRDVLVNAQTGEATVQ